MFVELIHKNPKNRLLFSSILFLYLKGLEEVMFGMETMDKMQEVATCFCLFVYFHLIALIFNILFSGEGKRKNNLVVHYPICLVDGLGYTFSPFCAMMHQ